MKLLSDLKVAIIYDRVNTPYGGAENVLLALQEIFPDAPLYTSVYDAERATWAKQFGAGVRTSFLQKIPGAKKFHRLFAFAMPLAFESLDLSHFEIVISVTSAEAKGVLTKPNQLHLCYLLTPTRYLWSHAEEYQDNWLTGGLRKVIFQYLRWWDEAAAFRPDVLIPISERVAERCREYYHREPAKVIYPTIYTGGAKGNSEVADKDQDQSGQNSKDLGEYYLIVSRLVPYKRIDLAIQACQRFGKNLVIIGQGPDLGRLQSLANVKVNAKTKETPISKITFLQNLTPVQVQNYYTHCKAFLSPAEEDFGMTVIEAQAAGKPVIVFAESGGAELVEEGVGGIHFAHQTLDGLVEAMYILESRKWPATEIQESVLQYTKAEFQKQFSAAVTEQWERFQKNRQ